MRLTQIAYICPIYQLLLSYICMWVFLYHEDCQISALKSLWKIHTDSSTLKQSQMLVKYLSAVLWSLCTHATPSPLCSDNTGHLTQ